MFRSVVCVLLLALGACDEETIARGRADSGVAEVDGGLGAPIALRAGWVFEYQGRATRREGRTEKESWYSLTLTLDAVDDRGVAGDSTATARATGMNIAAQTRNWEPTAGFDSWVANMGTTDAVDRVAAAPVVADLDDPPRQPVLPFGGATKQIPADRNFFLDMRRIDALRADFAMRHAMMGPSALAPDGARADWIFQLNGRDPAMAYYPDAVKLRNTVMQYDPRGFLVSMTERLGDSNDPTNPHGFFELKLVSERPQ